MVERLLAWFEAHGRDLPWRRTRDPYAILVSEVMRGGRGLVYTGRAGSLQRAAREVAANGWPEDLTPLPGVGRYTADAVACFAFDRPVLPLDVNVRRVLERTRASFDHTCAQALMDLGATVCIARVPRCS